MDILLFALSSDPSNRDFDDENELIKRIANGDQKALETIYERYNNLVYSVILKIVLKSEDAEEVTQEIFLQLWNKAKYFDVNKGNVYVWLMTLTRNKAIDKIRSKHYKMEKQTNDLEYVSLFQSSDAKSGLDASLSDERSVHVKAALSQLDEKQRILLEDAYYQGYSQTELAEKYEVPLGTVKTRMRSGLKKLRTLLEKSEIV